MTGFENLCVNCMSDTAGREECPVCGFPQNKPQMQHALPYKTMPVSYTHLRAVVMVISKILIKVITHAWVKNIVNPLVD